MHHSPLLEDDPGAPNTPSAMALAEEGRTGDHVHVGGSEEASSNGGTGGPSHQVESIQDVAQHSGLLARQFLLLAAAVILIIAGLCSPIWLANWKWKLNVLGAVTYAGPAGNFGELDVGKMGSAGAALVCLAALMLLCQMSGVAYAVYIRKSSAAARSLAEEQQRCGRVGKLWLIGTAFGLLSLVIYFPTADAFMNVQYRATWELWGYNYPVILYTIGVSLSWLPGIDVLGYNHVVLHVLSFSSSLYIFSFLITAAALAGQGGDNNNKMALVMLGIAGGLYVLYWIECFFSHTFAYVSNVDSTENAVQYVDRMRGMAPVISMSCECYHYETRTREVTHTNSKGKTVTKTEEYEAKVVTFRNTSLWQYTRFADNSGPIVGLENYQMVKLELRKAIIFGDVRSREAFNREYAAYQALYRNRDREFVSSWKCELPGYRERLLAFVNIAMKPGWVNGAGFLAASFFLATWPYRVWLDRRAVKKRFDLYKAVYHQ